MGPRIIVVHYDPEFLVGAAQMLQQAGFEVAAFENSLAAWDAVKQPGLEMLITKVRVPDGQPNGVALAQMALQYQRALKVIFLSSDPRDSDFTNGLGISLSMPLQPAAMAAYAARMMGKPPPEGLAA
ncbi:MAG TPA: response regulator [Acidobacteriaceae bacterium]|jgi:CheY-like chemotaxis protein|nr:response regulator [Acidobacteriaceae bacterium]